MMILACEAEIMALVGPLKKTTDSNGTAEDTEDNMDGLSPEEAALVAEGQVVLKYIKY